MISIDIKNEQHVHEDSRNRNRASSFRDISKTKDYENNFKDPEKIRYETMRILSGIFAKLFLTET